MASSRNMKSVAILICGDVYGKIKSLFKRIEKLNKEKGPFEALYCVGNFFGKNNSDWELILRGELKAPIPCYILGACKAEHVQYYKSQVGEELAPNIIYLGKKGLLTTVSGIKVAYLSGVEGHANKDYVFTAKDVVTLQNNFQALSLRGVDLLLTSPWPKNVTKNLPSNKELRIPGSELISYLAVTLKPCYHFAGFEEMFYERIPYRNTRTFSNKVSHTTRFIGLGCVGNRESIQFLYGINHVPLHEASEDFLIEKRSREIVTESPYQSFMHNRSEFVREVMYSRPKLESMQTLKPIGQVIKKSDIKVRQKLECWFCLGSKAEEHLIVTVGNNCYVALAKGWLVPDHLLIIPILHYPSMSNIPDHVLEEIDSYKHVLNKYYRTKQKRVVFYERNYRSPHMQLQVVAIPEHVQDWVEEAFLNNADSLNIALEEISPYSALKQVVEHNIHHFYLEFESKHSCPKKFLCIIKEEFPLEFARNVLAQKSLLNVPHRVDWKSCTESIKEQTDICEKLRADFRHYITSAAADVHMG